jgi:hypothetical protein
MTKAVTATVAADTSHLDGFGDLCSIIAAIVEEKAACQNTEKLPAYSPTERSVLVTSLATWGVPEAIPMPPMPYTNVDKLFYGDSDSSDKDIRMVNCYNPGSVGHPELCSRKCLYFAAGDCSNGDSCNFCHLPHQKRPARLDRMGRDMLRRMSFAERAEIILPILQSKMETSGIAVEAVQSLENCIALISLEYSGYGSSGIYDGSKQKANKFKMVNALKWHSVRSLIKLLCDDSRASPTLVKALMTLAEQFRQ